MCLRAHNDNRIATSEAPSDASDEALEVDPAEDSQGSDSEYESESEYDESESSSDEADSESWSNCEWRCDTDPEYMRLHREAGERWYQWCELLRRMDDGEDGLEVEEHNCHIEYVCLMTQRLERRMELLDVRHW
jgi:hypothetical protein